MARPRRMWVIYRAIGERYIRRRYFRFYNNGAFTGDKLWPSTASLYDTKMDAETAALLHATKYPEMIGKLFVTHAIR